MGTDDFGLVLANPPYIPSTSSLLGYGDGGADGEVVVAEIFLLLRYR
jgi:methylase of polypeptide subunit release factors